MKRSTAPVSQRSWVQIPYRPEFFSDLLFITANVAIIFTSLSAAQIYDFHISTAVYSPLHGFIWNHLPAGLLAHLVEHCTVIAEVMGSNPVEVWIFFFRPSFHYCLSSIHYCGDRYHIHVFIRSSNIWLSYIHSRLVCQVVGKAIRSTNRCPRLVIQSNHMGQSDERKMSREANENSK